jgi:hypothetical protein
MGGATWITSSGCEPLTFRGENQAREPIPEPAYGAMSDKLDSILSGENDTSRATSPPSRPADKLYEPIDHSKDTPVRKEPVDYTLAGGRPVTRRSIYAEPLHRARVIHSRGGAQLASRDDVVPDDFPWAASGDAAWHAGEQEWRSNVVPDRDVNDDIEVVYTTGDLARTLGISRRHLRRLIHSGQVPDPRSYLPGQSLRREWTSHEVETILATVAAS